jgi:hypothetical protein
MHLPLTARTHTARVVVAIDKSSTGETPVELHARMPEADARVSSAEWVDAG